MFEERQSKGEFHVLVKELKLFDHEFYLLIACIQPFYWLIILLSNIFSRFGVEFFQTPKEKNNFQSKEKKLLSS